MDHPQQALREIQKRTPLWQDAWAPGLLRVLEHPGAPQWTAYCGDQQTLEDQTRVRAWARGIGTAPGPQTSAPPAETLAWIARILPHSLFFQQRLHGLDLVNHPDRDWVRIRPMTRSNLQSQLPLVIPQNQDLSRLIVNPTSGTTGQPIPCPSLPWVQGCYEPLDLWALGQHGFQVPAEVPGLLGAQLCHQVSTLVYTTVHSYSQGRPFAKVNIHPQVWPTDQAQAFLTDLNPQFISGDPYSFLMAREQGLKLKPQVLLSTALTLTPEHRKILESWFEAPVCDIYSLNETGPLTYSDPGDPGLHRILAPDIFVEILDDEGFPAAPGDLGWITVTGGRNPLIPLLRYRTGDQARRDPQGLRDLRGRGPVVFTTGSGNPLNTIDLARILRTYPILAYRMTQTSDLRVHLEIEAPALDQTQSRTLQNQLCQLLESRLEWMPLSPGTLGPKLQPFIKEGPAAP